VRGGVTGRGRPRARACSAPRRRRVAGRVRRGLVGVVAPLGQRDGGAEVVPRTVLVVMAHGRRLVRCGGCSGAVDEIGRERQVQRQGAQRAEARAELSVDLAQARILPAYELGR
jgi:hypothetical protein